jgi:adenine-specific DNA-methyltransferase
VALALARARIMGARYPFYLLADSREGQVKEAEVTRTAPSSQPTHGDIRHGFVYERVPHITLKSIANNAEIDVIWEKWQATLEPLREQRNNALKQEWQEWEIPRDAEPKWPETARKLHADWWHARIARQKEIDASIAAKAEFEYLYDRPYVDNRKVRVAGPFTVESLSPHRVMTDAAGAGDGQTPEPVEDHARFIDMVLDNLRRAGVQNQVKDQRLQFETLDRFAGRATQAEGFYQEGGERKRAAVAIGPQYGTVGIALVREAAKEAAGWFDLLIVTGFAFDARADELKQLGNLPIVAARMNADLLLGDQLKKTGAGNLFTVFGQPDVELRTVDDGQLKVDIRGIDVYDPTTGEIRSDSPNEIASWFIDTDYNGESFFVRHAYFCGGDRPYERLQKTLKAEIDPDAWETLYSATSRPFPRPGSGKIAVKVINHYGDEILKVYEVGDGQL